MLFVRKYEHDQKGFTLIEIALVILILSLISGGILYGISEYQKSYKDRDSKQRLLYIKKMLLNFTSMNKFVPCPDTDGDGVENRTGIACTANSGEVPYNTIGLQAGDVRDSWGNPIKYYVPVNADNAAQICADATQYAASYLCKTPPDFYTVDTPPTDTNTDSANTYDILNAATGGNVIAADVPIVLVALNANGKQLCSSFSADEKENCDGDQQFVMHGRTDSPFFDDNVLGISGYEIKRKEVIDATALSDELLKGCIVDAICGDLKASGKKGDDLQAYADELKAEPKSFAMRGIADARAQMEDERFNELIQRVKDDVKKMTEMEFAYLNNKEQCQLPPESYQNNPASYTRKFQVSFSETVQLGQGEIKDNLYVETVVQPNADVTGSSVENDIYIASNNYGTLDLKAGNDVIVVGNDSSGTILAGEGDDTVRICGSSQSGSASVGYDIDPVKLRFIDGRYLGNFRWLYRNVIDDNTLTPDQQADAIVEITDYAPGFRGFCFGILLGPRQFCLNYMDNDNIGYDYAIQPGYTAGYGFLPGDEIWLEIKVSFYKHVSWWRIPTELKNLSFFASVVDLDAWRGDWVGFSNMEEEYEYVWLYGPLFGLTENKHNDYSNNEILISYYGSLENVPVTFMDVMVENNILKAVAREPWVTPGLDVDFTQTLVSGGYKHVSAFTYRIGLKPGEEFNYGHFRFNSIWFGDPPYEEERVIPVSGNIDLGNGQDSLVILSDAVLNINSGGGGDYIYVFGGSYEKLTGSDDTDLVATIGDLGYANGANTPGWDLLDGKNSAYINGSCYAPLAVGQDDDTIIINGDQSRDCALELKQGRDYVYVMGVANQNIDAGSGDDMVDVDRIGSGAQIRLGEGDDILVVHNAVSGSVEAGDGDDYVEADTLDAGISVSGGAGDNDTLVLNGVSLYDWNHGVQDQVSDFEEVRLMDATVTP